MSTVNPATDRQEKLARGEKLIVTAFMPAVVTEGFLLPLGLAMSRPFSPVGLVYGLVTFGLLLWAVSRLYNGQENARLVAEGLALLQGLVAFVCTILLAYSPHADIITNHFAQPALWISVIRLGAYLLLGLILLFCRDVLDFMASRRGEEIAQLEPVVASGVVVTFSDRQKEHFAKLPSALSNSGGILLVTGVLLLAFAFTRLPHVSPEGLTASLPQLGPWLGQYILPGMVALLSGVVLVIAAPAARRVESEGTDRTYLVGLLGSLAALFRWQMIITGLGALAALLTLIVLLNR
jgi:hypothetical protein